MLVSMKLTTLSLLVLGVVWTATLQTLLISHFYLLVGAHTALEAQIPCKHSITPQIVVYGGCRQLATLELIKRCVRLFL